jgi:signal recognition particle subunit SRP54
MASLSLPKPPGKDDKDETMFESLSDRLGKIFDGLRGRGALTPQDVEAALREVRRALIEADVSLEVVRAFVEQVRDRAVGTEVTR